MSDIILGGAYSVRDLTIGRPRVKVISSIINGGLYLPETSFVLRYKRGMFDGSNPTFRTDTTVWIYDDDGDLIFDGYVSGVQTGQGQTTISCVSAVNRILSTNMEFTLGPEHPAFILSKILTSLGIEHKNMNIAASYYPDILSVYVSSLSDNSKGRDVISSLIEMMSMDVAFDSGEFIAIPLPVGGSTYNSAIFNTPYTLIGAGYPQLIDDGVQRLTKGVSINYVFSGGLPLSTGSTTDHVWTQDYGAGSNLQLYGLESAAAVANARFNRFINARPLYMVPINRKHIYKPVLGNCYNVASGGMNGPYRLVGYETDGKSYWLYMEAI